jgi:hypothetical protein
MQEALKEYLHESELAAQWQAVETAVTLEAMRAAAWVLARARVLLLMSQVLEARAAQPQSWPDCKACGKQLQSKGWVPRQWTGVIGTWKWRRRIGRCPSGCKIGQVDVTLCEDASRIRQNPGLFARLRSFALNLLRANGETNISLALYDNALNIDRVLQYVGVLR